MDITICHWPSFKFCKCLWCSTFDIMSLHASLSNNLLILFLVELFSLFFCCCVELFSELSFSSSSLSMLQIIRTSSSVVFVLFSSIVGAIRVPYYLRWTIINKVIYCCIHLIIMQMKVFCIVFNYITYLLIIVLVTCIITKEFIFISPG